jgi:hypothetical protein
MLCAHEWVLQLLMPSLVDVRVKEIVMENLSGPAQSGPIPLIAEVTGCLCLVTRYQNVLVSIRRKPDTATIIYEPLRSPGELTTTHALVGTTPPSHPLR